MNREQREVMKFHITRMTDPPLQCLLHVFRQADLRIVSQELKYIIASPALV